MKNKTVIITGASSGIGKALAEKFSAEGSNVVIAARDKEKLNHVFLKLKKNNPHVLAVTCDVSKEEDCSKLIGAAAMEFNHIDVLINNAGMSMRALFEDVDLNVLKKLMDVNFWGAVYCTKYAMPFLLKSKGSVVGISSIAGKKGLPARTGYSASKFALEGFLETLRTENLKRDLHVLVACPGFTQSNIRNTALTKDGTAQGESPRKEEKMMSAETVASKIYDAIVKRKRDIVLSSDGKMLIFLNKFFPKMTDKIVFQHMAKEDDSPLK